MVSVGLIMILFRQMVTINMDKWEHYGNYFIGASMVLCALYFMAREGAFLKEDADGTLVPVPCACHGSVPVPRHSRRDVQHARAPRFCASYCPPCCEEGEDAE